MQSHIVLKPAADILLTASTSAVGFTETDIPKNVVAAILTIRQADANAKFNGDPAAGVGGGLFFAQNSVWEIEGRDNLVNVKFIRDSGTDAIINAAMFSGG